MQNQSAQWLQIRRERPDFVIMWGWGAMNAGAITEAVNVDDPKDDPTNYGFFVVDENECTRCALCIDRCPTGVISLGKFEGSLADQAAELGLNARPWDVDTGQRDFKHGYSYGMRW